MQALHPNSLTPAVAVLLAVFSIASPMMATELEFNDDDTVVVTADKAWEAEAPDVVHFSGDFIMQAPDWSLSGDEAVVHGKLDNPDKVVVSGNPARISFLRQEDAEQGGAAAEERVDGSAASVEYFRATDKLRMNGEARLTRKGSTLASDFIEYNVDSDRYSARGSGGINLKLDPDDE